MSPERELTRLFRRQFNALFNRFHGEPVCKCGQPARPGQRNCRDCAAAAQRAYRARRRHEREANSPLARLADRYAPDQEAR